MSGVPRVLHIIDELPPDGAERLLVDVLSKRSAKFDYRVLCLVQGGVLQSAIEELGVPVDILGKKPGFDPDLVARISRYLREQRIDVVHTHLFTADFWARWAAHRVGVRAVLSTSHSENNWKTRLHRFLDRRMARHSYKVIACTEKVKSVLIDRDGISAEKVCVVSNGIDLERFRSTELVDLAGEFSIEAGVPTLALIGRYHPVKGHLYFLDVFARLLAHHKVHLLFVGEGEIRADIEAQVAALDIADAVSLTGFRDDVPAILNAVDIVVVPSELEGLPMVVLESMARGKPVVAHDVGGIAAVIDSAELGRVVAPADSNAMLAALRELLTSPELRDEIGRNASQRVRAHFDVRQTAAAYEQLYLEALQQA